MLEIISIILSSISIIMILILLLKKSKTADEREADKLISEISRQQSQLRQEVSNNITASTTSISAVLSDNQNQFTLSQKSSLEDLSKSINAQLTQFEQRLKTLEQTNEQKLDAMRGTISKQLNYLQEDNSKKLDEIRTTVDEKLQKTLEDKMTKSFELVSTRLEEVYKGLGEMQSLAKGVGDLKNVLSNVKTRGILGEIQLGAILQEILSPEQYETEKAVNPHSRERVEFAIKMPGQDSSQPVYLPIDSKFPGDTYAALQEAYKSGDTQKVNAAYSALEKVIKTSAKDINNKYICPPYTTNFAIMFLPFEGLYAEVVNRGLVEVLQREYKINIAGPSTMAAMLNSLQMGFKTLQIQKRSNEVWEILGAVKTEFASFDKVLNSAKTRIRQLDDDIDKLVGVRTRAINRKLKDIEEVDRSSSQKILELEEPNE